MQHLNHDMPALPSMVSDEERNWAVGAHVGGVVAGALTSFTAGAAAPVVAFAIWLYVRDKMPFAAHHARESFNFHLTMVLLAGLLLFFVIGTLGLGIILAIPAFLVMAVVWLWCTVHAAIRAWHGQDYRYPFTLRLLR